MPSDSEINDAREFLREETLKPYLLRPWRPRFTLGHVIFFVVIVALGAAYYAKTREINTLKHEYETRFRQEAGFHSKQMNALNFVSGTPSLANFDFVHVYSENEFGSNKNRYSILVYLDPTKRYLLRYATQDIPREGAPLAQQTYYIKAVGDKRDSLNIMRFQVEFLGTGYHYNEYEQPFEGQFVIHTYFSNFSGAGTTNPHHDTGWLPKRMVSDPLKINKDKKIRDWIYLLLEHGTQTGSMRDGLPIQLVRIRSNPNAPEPCPGVMLWLEQLGDEPEPKDAQPFQSRPTNP